MRPRPALALLVVCTLLVAGCVDRSPDRDREQRTEDDNGRTTTTTTTTAPGTGNDTSQPSTEPTADPREPSPPDEQKKDDPDDVERPGDHAMLPYREGRRTDVRLDVPRWTPDDAWTYQTRIVGAPPCTPEPGTSSTDYRYTDTVHGTSTLDGASTYRVEQVVSDCNGNEVSRNEHAHLVDHLVRIDPDGYVAWTLLFPLEDGKRWLWRDDDGHDRTSETTYLPSYLWNGRSVPAWRVITERDDGHLEQERVFAAVAGNLLFSEERVDGAAVTTSQLVAFERNT